MKYVEVVADAGGYSPRAGRAAWCLLINEVLIPPGAA